MKKVLITGGAGFFGSLLKAHLLERGVRCVSVDLERDEASHPDLLALQLDIRHREDLERLFREHRFDHVFHLAAKLAHAVKDPRDLWESNVTGTLNVAEAADAHGVKSLVFTSTNCLWAEGFVRAVNERDQPRPVEIYGRSKWQAEEILLDPRRRVRPVILRCPTIVDEGRLGLLAILFQFVEEHRKIWMVGDGQNRYQFIYGRDLIQACLRGAETGASGVFNVGSENIPTFIECYQELIRHAGSRSRIVCLPRRPAILAMQLAHVLKLSPLGPYQYKMIAESFEFSIAKARQELGWRPTLTNADMLRIAYDDYLRSKHELTAPGRSAHRRPAEMGIIQLLKMVS